MKLHVSLRSGRCESFVVNQSAAVSDLKAAVQQSFGRCFLKLAAPTGTLLVQTDPVERRVIFFSRQVLFFLVLGSILSCFADFLLFCFSAFCFPCSFLLLLLLFYFFFSSIMCFCCSTSCSFASLLPVFTVSLFFIFFCFVLFVS